jgi:hypothetical protein
VGRSERLAETIQIADTIGRMAAEKRRKPSRRAIEVGRYMALCKKRKLSKERLSEIARNAVRVRWAKFRERKRLEAAEQS